MRPPTALLLITKVRHQAAAALTRTLAAWLEDRGVRVTALSAAAPPETLRAAAAAADAAVVLGGDGTFVGAARKLLGSGTPLLGINHGRVGFLTEVPAAAWQAPLERLVQGDLPVVPRAALAWSLVRQGRVVREGHAINDLVSGRAALARVLSLSVAINGHAMGLVRADGLIIATPTGSSGYVLSAGGSLIHPDMQALTLAPVSPFQSVFPSMVLPLDARITLSVDDHEGYLTVDGQEGEPLLPGDTLEARALPDALPLLVPDPYAYYRRLLECGFVRPARGKSRRAGALRTSAGALRTTKDQP